MKSWAADVTVISRLCLCLYIFNVLTREFFQRELTKQVFLKREKEEGSMEEVVRLMWRNHEQQISRGEETSRVKNIESSWMLKTSLAYNSLCHGCLPYTWRLSHSAAVKWDLLMICKINQISSFMQTYDAPWLCNTTSPKVRQLICQLF